MIVTPQTSKCKRGHPLSDDNVFVYLKPAGPYRRCKTCVRMQKGQRPRIAQTVLQRIFKRIRFDDNGCWTWLGWLHNGYGAIGFSGGHVTRPVHRVVYELLVGPVPEGLELDHLCRNRACVNVDHLEAVTHQVNAQRAWAARQMELAA